MKIKKTLIIGFIFCAILFTGKQAFACSGNVCNFDIYVNPTLPTGVIYTTSLNRIGGYGCIIETGSKSCFVDLAVKNLIESSSVVLYRDTYKPYNYVKPNTYANTYVGYWGYLNNKLTYSNYGHKFLPPYEFVPVVYFPSGFNFITPSTNASDAIFYLYDLYAPVDTNLSYHGYSTPPRKGYYQIDSVTVTATCKSDAEWDKIKAVCACKAPKELDAGSKTCVDCGTYSKVYNLTSKSCVACSGLTPIYKNGICIAEEPIHNGCINNVCDPVVEPEVGSGTGTGSNTGSGTGTGTGSNTGSGTGSGIVCDDPTPKYDSSTGKCIACPVLTPKYNSANNTCSKKPPTYIEN